MNKVAMYVPGKETADLNQYFVTEGTWAITKVEEVWTGNDPYYLRRNGDKYNYLTVDGKVVMERRGCFSLYKLIPGQKYGELVWSNEEKLRGFSVSPQLEKNEQGISYFAPANQDIASPGHING